MIQTNEDAIRSEMELGTTYDPNAVIRRMMRANDLICSAPQSALMKARAGRTPLIGHALGGFGRDKWTYRWQHIESGEPSPGQGLRWTRNSGLRPACWKPS